MSALILDAMDGIITVEFIGQINSAELAEVQGSILYHLLFWGGGGILCFCENFQGFTLSNSKDESFQIQAAPLIHKMAVFGESPWKKLAPSFIGQGVQPFSIAHFQPGCQSEARAWLRA